MNTCPNCGNQLGCSCQLRTASNGQTVCTSCVIEYEKLINPELAQPEPESVQVIHINLDEKSSTQSS
jgi:transcription elongation factor Elf1